VSRCGCNTIQLTLLIADPFHIPVPSNDKIFDPIGTGTQFISLSRTEFKAVDNRTGARIHTNGFTAYIDCSGLYGNSIDDMNSMRQFKDGLLKGQIIDNLGEFPPITYTGPKPGIFTFSIDAISMVPVGNMKNTFKPFQY
jgi:hypothetical protein